MRYNRFVFRVPAHVTRESYLISLLSKRGTISSTSVFGVLPSEVTPVAQFYTHRFQCYSFSDESERTCSTFAIEGSFRVSNNDMHSSAILRCTENYAKS